MKKYSFLVYHLDYTMFLDNIQKLGLLHIIEKKESVGENILEKYQLIKQIDNTIKFFQKRKIEDKNDSSDKADEVLILNTTNTLQSKLESQELKLATLKKKISNILPWGNFSIKTINKLKEADLKIRFFICSAKGYNKKWEDLYNAEIINEIGTHIYFIAIQKCNDTIDIDAEEIQIPKESLSQLETDKEKTIKKIKEINTDLDELAAKYLQPLKNIKNSIIEISDYERALYFTEKEADDKLMVLEGWVPQTKEKDLIKYLDESKIYYYSSIPKKKEATPILLKNNRFSKLFEPIGKLFSLPAYAELDLTAFFAPFFMLFFGFCLGDAGYGLLLLVGATIYKPKAKADLKPILSLVQVLGIATVIFGIITGTIFGVDLIKTDIQALSNVKHLFLDADNLFYLSLGFGVIQIIFGLCIKAANEIKQNGLVYALATFGWIVLILGSIAFFGFQAMGKIRAGNFVLLKMLIGFSLFFILFFSDPKLNIFARIGKGIYDIYSMVTGIMGDLLSYIRLFALGLSSAILGFVINDLALQLLNTGPVIGHLLFVILLLVGHSINLFIAGLGSFVHPMRLTFVEFYKNSGFLGGGKEFKPLKKN